MGTWSEQRIRKTVDNQSFSPRPRKKSKRKKAGRGRPTLDPSLFASRLLPVCTGACTQAGRESSRTWTTGSRERVAPPPPSNGCPDFFGLPKKGDNPGRWGGNTVENPRASSNTFGRTDEPSSTAFSTYRCQRKNRGRYGWCKRCRAPQGLCWCAPSMEEAWTCCVGDHAHRLVDTADEARPVFNGPYVLAAGFAARLPRVGRCARECIVCAGLCGRHPASGRQWRPQRRTGKR